MSRLARRVACACLALVAGCGSSHAPEEVTTYFVNDLLIPIPDDVGRVAGIDLDGVDSDGLDASMCTNRIRDGVSSYDPTERGIDNMIALLLGARRLHGSTDSDPTATELVGSGELRIALRVSGVDSYEDDDDVDVQLGTARVPACDESAPETCRPALDGDMLAQAGQSMVFEPVGSPSSMRIVGGRLLGELGDLTLVGALLDVPPESVALPLTIRDVRIDATIDAGGLEGLLGGPVRFADLVELTLAVDPSASVDDLRSQFDFNADLEPSPSDPGICDAFSIGIQFGAVPVTTLEP